MDSGVATRPIADMAAYFQQLSEFVYHSGFAMKPVFAAAKKNPARIVFADIDPRYFTIDAADREDATVQALNYEENKSAPKTLTLQRTDTDATVSITDEREIDAMLSNLKKKRGK
jgi:hypothetical protein